MTSNETIKSPGGSPANVHFRVSRPDPAAASFTLWKPLAAGFMSRRRKWNMLHFHSHQSADAVPGKLHNDVDIAKWLCKKMFFSGEKHVGENQEMISAYTCVHGVVKPLLFGQTGGTETRKHLPCQRYQHSPLSLRAAAEQESAFLSTLLRYLPGALAVGSSQPYAIRRVTLLALLSFLLFLPRRKSWEQKTLKWKITLETLELCNRHK